jgi:CRISPR-associated protein Csx1
MNIYIFLISIFRITMKNDKANNIVIASWGNPTNNKEIKSWKNPEGWKRVTYTYNQIEKCTFASTLALTEILNIDYGNVIIFLPSSLAADPNIYGGIFNNKNIDFNIIENGIRNFISQFINQRHGNISPKLIVVPSIGSFGKFKFEGNAESYLTSIYYHTLDMLKRNYNNNRKKKLHIHLDITHGINYMPLMCKEAVELAANTFAVITDKEVQVTVYNSDPVSPPPQQDNCDIKLNINEIYKITYNGCKSMEQLLLKFVLDYNINNNYYENKLIKDVNADISQDDLECLYKLSKAVSSGILLVLPYKDSLIRCLKDKLERLLKDNAREAKLNNNFVIEHPKSSYRIALLHSVLTVLDSIKLDVCKEGGWIGVSFESLKDKLEYYKNTLDSVYYIVSNELNALDTLDKAQKIPTNNYELYGRIKYGSSFNNSKEGKADSRVLYAHAGLEENVTFIKKVDDKIFVSYGNYFKKVFEKI